MPKAKKRGLLDILNSLAQKMRGEDTGTESNSGTTNQERSVARYEREKRNKEYEEEKRRKVRVARRHRGPSEY